MTKWNPIRTVPRDRTITLKTVTGIVCKGRVPKSEKIRPADRWGERRIAAKRMDASVVIGDIRAVAWR